MRFILERNMHLLQLAMPFDETVLVAVDQNIVDRRILQQRLKRAEADHLVDDVVDQRVEFGAIDRQAFLTRLFQNEIMHLPAHLVARQTFKRDQVDLFDQHPVQARTRVDDLVRRLCRPGFRLGLRLARRGNDDRLILARRRLRRPRRPGVTVLQGGEAAAHADFLNRFLPRLNSERDFLRPGDHLVRQDDALQVIDDVGVGIDFMQRHAAIDRFAHEAIIVGNAADEMIAEDLLNIGLLEAVLEHFLLEAIDDDVGLHLLADRLIHRLDQALRMAQARHRHFGDDVELVGAEQHCLRPGKPRARHVDDDIVEIRRDKIEHAHDHVGVERPHFRRARRRRENAQAARMFRQHDIKQLPVQALRLVLDFGDVEARLEVEIFRAGALLEIEIDDTGRSAARHRMLELECSLQRQCRGAHPAGGRHEGIDLRFRIFLAAGPLQDADAGAHEIGRGDRLDQEVGDLKLDEYANSGGVELLRDDEDRRLALKPPRDALQRLDFLDFCGIHIDDDGAAIGFLNLAAQFGHVLLDDGQLDQVRGSERRLGVLQEKSCRSRQERSAWSWW